MGQQLSFQFVGRTLGALEGAALALVLSNITGASVIRRGTGYTWLSWGVATVAVRLAVSQSDGDPQWVDVVFEVWSPSGDIDGEVRIVPRVAIIVTHGDEPPAPDPAILVEGSTDATVTILEKDQILDALNAVGLDHTTDDDFNGYVVILRGPDGYKIATTKHIPVPAGAYGDGVEVAGEPWPYNDLASYLEAQQDAHGQCTARRAQEAIAVNLHDAALIVDGGGGD